MKHTPVVVDHTLLSALAIKYAIYALWGVSAAIGGISTITQVGGPWYEAWWPALVAILSASLILPVLFGKEKLELSITPWWLGVVVIYPLFLIYRWIFLGTLESPHLIVLSFAYLVIPVWRFQFLFRKNRKTSA